MREWDLRLSIGSSSYIQPPGRPHLQAKKGRIPHKNMRVSEIRSNDMKHTEIISEEAAILTEQNGCKCTPVLEASGS